MPSIAFLGAWIDYDDSYFRNWTIRLASSTTINIDRLKPSNMDALLQHSLVLRKVPVVVVFEYASLLLFLTLTCKHLIQFSKAKCNSIECSSLLQGSVGFTATGAFGRLPLPTRNGSPAQRASPLEAMPRNSKPTALPVVRPGTLFISDTDQPTR